MEKIAIKHLRPISLSEVSNIALNHGDIDFALREFLADAP
jgi:hypothetical protein